MARQRRTSRRGRSSEKTRADLLGWLIFLGVGALAAGIGYFVYEAMKAHPTLDEATLCPKSGPIGVIAIIVDTTDSVTPIQRADIENRLRSLRMELPRFWMVSVYQLTEAIDVVPSPEISLCNPGRGEDLSKITANPELVEKRWRSSFEEPIASIIDEMTQKGEGNASPIMEMVQAVAVSNLTTPEINALPKRLILVSDMLQYSENFSLYRSIPEFDQFAKSPVSTVLGADLRGVSVEIFLIVRPTKVEVQSLPLVHFWEAYFDHYGASLDRVLKMSG